jgi:hypothetical protein
MEKLFNRLANPSGLIYHDKNFIDYIEMNMADLRKQSIEAGQTIDVSAMQQIRAKHNFNLLCNIAGIPYYLHWITMRINHMTSASEFEPNTTILYQVDSQTLSNLILKFNESQTIV